MSIDLHTHSSFSDGTQTPEELLQEAAQVGLQTIGLTDHDTVRGWADAAVAAKREGLSLVRGMEVSCKHEGVTVHMLSYLHNPDGAELSAAVADMRMARLERGQRMVELLSRDYPLNWDDLLAVVGPEATIGRPHIADALVAGGFAADRSAAFAHLLSPRGPYYVPIPAISAIDAVRMVHDAGGVAVFAHPLASARGRVLSDAAIGELIEAGLDGLEIDHRDNPPEGRRRLRRMAEEHNLIVTGSSDYHGAGKPNRLGENITEPEQLERIAERARGVEVLHA